MSRRVMRFDVLATDYDGTIAHDGLVDDLTLAALHRARAAGVSLVLVTGRELVSLTNTFPHLAIFDRVVAENGAVLFDPKSQSIRVLALPPPPALVERLARRNVPLSVGHCIVATVEPHEHEVRQAIHDLGLDWHIIFNKGSVMVLPGGVTKATGLQAALDELGVKAERTIGIGDAENDQAFLESCGLTVAVSNALPAVKENADIVTEGERGAGVVECIDRWLGGAFGR